MKSIEEVLDYAFRLHDSVGQTYGNNYPYRLHLELVLKAGADYEYLLPRKYPKTIITSCLALHDTMEDCRLSYNDLLKEFGVTVADCVYLVTDEKGMNREEKHKLTYPKLAESKNHLAVWVKLIDRLANMRFSYIYNNKALRKYSNEYKYFSKVFENYYDMFKPIFCELETLSSLAFNNNV